MMEKKKTFSIRYQLTGHEIEMIIHVMLDDAERITKGKILERIQRELKENGRLFFDWRFNDNHDGGVSAAATNVSKKLFKELY